MNFNQERVIIRFILERSFCYCIDFRKLEERQGRMQKDCLGVFVILEVTDKGLNKGGVSGDTED